MTLAWLKIFTDFENKTEDVDENIEKEVITLDDENTHADLGNTNNAISAEVQEVSVSAAIAAESTITNNNSNPPPPPIMPNQNAEIAPKEVPTSKPKAKMLKPHWLDNLALYLNLEINQIKSRIFKEMNMTEATSILSSIKDDVEKYSPILQLSNFISFYIPLITSHTTDAYKKIIRAECVEKITESERESNRIITTTATVANAISNEASMPSSRMEDILEKKVNTKFNKVLAKNLKAGRKVTFALSQQESKNTPPSNHRRNHQRNNKKNKAQKRKNSTPPPPRRNQTKNPKKLQRSHSPKKCSPAKKNGKKWNQWIRKPERNEKDRQEESANGN